MNLDDIPDQFEELIDRARAVLDREITRAKEIVASATAEKSAAQSALSALQTQHRKAKADLDAVLATLHRSSNLAGLDGEIAAARKTLERLKTETEAERNALAKATKQRTEEETKTNALRDEVGQLSARRAHDQEVMAKIRHQLGLQP
jgi:chromosome segregation ATPase